MVKIILFKLGYSSDLDLNKVAKFLNASKMIQASIAEPIQNIGSPDLYGMGYSITYLSRFFRRTQAEDSLQFGITSAPIELDYFSHLIDYHNIIVSLNLSDEVCAKAAINKEQYIAYTILRQGTWAVYSEARNTTDKGILFHDDIRGCLFDYCWNKLDIIEGLKGCRIDDICRGKLVEANIPSSLIDEIEKLLRSIRTPTFFGSFVLSLQNPVFGFIFGGLIIGALVNVFSTMVLNESNKPGAYYVLGALLGVALFMILGNYIWVLLKTKRNKNS